MMCILYTVYPVPLLIHIDMFQSLSEQHNSIKSGIYTLLSTLYVYVDVDVEYPYTYIAQYIVDAVFYFLSNK